MGTGGGNEVNSVKLVNGSSVWHGWLAYHKIRKTFTKVGTIRAAFDLPAFLNNNSLILCLNTKPTYQKYEYTILKCSF